MHKKLIKFLFMASCLVAAAATVIGCSPAATTTTTAAPQTTGFPIAQPKVRFKIATTTSLYDTGLWAYLEPMFEKEANVELDIVYAGTGAAINQGKAGNVDAVIVHDPDQEKVFVSDNYGINKRAFAYNFFMIAGPASDPAGIKGLDPVAAFKKIAEGGKKDSNAIKFISRGDEFGHPRG